MRAIRSWGLQGWLVAAVVLLGACSDDKAVDRSPGDTRAQPAAAAAAAAPVQQGLRFTIDGPAFGGPTRFVVPGDHPRLNAYVSDNMFNVTFRPQPGVLSEDGKHRLDLLILGLEPAATGESTDANHVKEFAMAFTAHQGTPHAEDISMDFRYSKGTRQPVRLTLDRYNTTRDERGATGHFTGSMQRTNIKSTDQIYEAKGEFQVR